MRVCGVRIERQDQKNQCLAFQRSFAKIWSCALSVIMIVVTMMMMTMMVQCKQGVGV